MLPPRGKIFIGSGDFEEVGRTHLTLFIELAGLEPNHNVLDIGSGIGRMAIPLTSYLHDTSIYDGFDIVEQGVDWCQKNIQSKYPNFRFRLTALQNDLYTSGGNSATQFTFPYQSDFYDFVISTSVFTHMQLDEVNQYLKEMNRILRIGGKAFVNFFIINERSKEAMESQPAFTFPYDFGDYYLMDQSVISANIAYQEEVVDRMILDAGLSICDKYYGSWAEYPGAVSFQDIYILGKE
jgi:cyclopropane fatty-acyl-phospholipid synthase-like methyltransferase